RLLGVSVGFLILATLVSAFRHHRREPKIFWPTLAAFLLVGFQGWLRGVVVKQELAAWIVTVHLIVALVIVSLLLYSTVYAFFAASMRGTDVSSRRMLAIASLTLIAITLGQIALGAQVRGGVDAALDRGVARGDALATVGSMDHIHRDTALIVLLTVAFVGVV